jgi:hypothetical protein
VLFVATTWFVTRCRVVRKFWIVEGNSEYFGKAVADHRQDVVSSLGITRELKSPNCNYCHFTKRYKRIRTACCKHDNEREFLGSHGGEYEDGCLDCCVLYIGSSLQTFQRYFLPPSPGMIALMLGAVITSETSLCRKTRRNNPDTSGSGLSSRTLLRWVSY